MRRRSTMASVLAGALVLAGLVMTGFSAPAAAGSWKFGITNKTGTPIVGFKTKEGGAWSSNWLESSIKPGEEFEMDFGTAEGDCVVRTQVTFSDKSYFDYNVDYCKVSELFVHDDKITWK